MGIKNAPALTTTWSSRSGARSCSPAEALLRGGSHSTDQVKLYVSYLRRKLRGAPGVEPISTVRGSGYRYDPT